MSSKNIKEQTKERVVLEEKIIDSFMSDWNHSPSFFAKWLYCKPCQLFYRVRTVIRNTKQKLTTGFPHHEAYNFSDWFVKAAVPRLKLLRDTTHSFPDLTDEGKRYGEATVSSITGASDKGLIKWKEEIDKIIWSLEHYDDDIQPTPPENYDHRCIVTKFSDGSTQYAPMDKRPYDHAPCKAHTKKVQKGLNLFAKHFYDLWF